MQGYHTVKEVARLLNKTEAEVMGLINAYLSPKNLVIVDDGVLLGPAGARRLLQVVKTEEKRVKRAKPCRKTRTFRHHQQQEQENESLAGLRPDTPMREKELTPADDEENGGAGSDKENAAVEDGISKTWHSYPWPLSEWVRLTGKAPG